MSSKSELAIELIKQSDNTPLPPNQMEIPYYCETRISILKEAISSLEDEIKGLMKLSNSFNMNKSFNNNNNNFEGGKRRRQRKTRKLRR
jgi:hypothetical protein